MIFFFFLLAKLDTSLRHQIREYISNLSMTILFPIIFPIVPCIFIALAQFEIIYLFIRLFIKCHEKPLRT